MATLPLEFDCQRGLLKQHANHQSGENHQGEEESGQIMMNVRNDMSNIARLPLISLSPVAPNEQGWSRNTILALDVESGQVKLKHFFDGSTVEVPFLPYLGNFRKLNKI